MADPFGVQPCGYKCFDCPFEDCRWDGPDNHKKKNFRPLKKFELITYPAPEWKYRPRHLT